MHIYACVYARGFATRGRGPPCRQQPQGIPVKRQRHTSGILQRASVLALLMLLLAPAMQAAWVFSGPAAEDAPCHCPCCHGTCMCSRHARERQAQSGKLQAAEWSSTCPCPMAMPIQGHSESYAPPATPGGARIGASIYAAHIAYCRVRSPRRSPAHPRRGPPIFLHAC